MHERRQGLLRDDSGLLRLLRQHDEGWLHLLYDDEWHAGLLLLIDRIAVVNSATTRTSPLGFSGSVSSDQCHCTTPEFAWFENTIRRCATDLSPRGSAKGSDRFRTVIAAR